MMRSLWTGATGMLTQQKNIDVIANNLANINTVGYKKSTARFQDLMYQELKRAGTMQTNGETRPTGTQIGMGVKLASVDKSFQQGEMIQTGENLNLCISGKGFFRIATPEGIRYTRDGSFHLTSSGNLATIDGFLMDPALSIPAGIPSDKISISKTGLVQVFDETGASQDLGQIQLAVFSNEGGLESMGDNLYRVTPASGAEIVGNPGSGNQGIGSLEVGGLEMSNAKAVEEIVQLIEGQRAYEFNSKSIQTSDEMLQLINSLKR